MKRRTTTTIPPLAAALAALALAGCGATGSAATGPTSGAGSAPAGSTVPAAAGPSTTPGAGAAPAGTSPAVATSAAATPGAHLTESNPPGDIPDRQLYVPITVPGAHFTVSVPEGWARSTAGGTVRFSDKLNTITVQEVAAATAPTPASVQATAIAELRSQIPAFTPGTVSATSRAGGAVVLLTFAGDSAPDPVTNRVVRDAFERYAFWHNGYEAIVTLSGPVGADNVDPWKTVTDSLRWR